VQGLRETKRGCATFAHVAEFTLLFTHELLLVRNLRVQNVVAISGTPNLESKAFLKFNANQ
jgi:hypothetical protein